MTEPKWPRVDVDSVLDQLSLKGLPLLMIVSATVTLLLDGMNIQVIALAAPALIGEFGVTRDALGPVFAASLFGVAAGAFSAGPIGDRWGRRNPMLISTALFGAATLLAITSENLFQLTAWRFVTGIGLGGALPNAVALLAEYTPPRWRNQAIAAAIVGVPVGGMLGAAIGAEIIPLYGWRSIFIVGGVLPLMAVAAMYFVIAESPRYLAIRPNRKPELAQLLNRLIRRPQYSGTEDFILSSSALSQQKAGIGALFSSEFLRDTLAISVVSVTNLLAIYTFFSWAPIVLTSVGYPLATAVHGSFVFNLAGAVGSIANSWAISRFGSRWALGVLAALGALALAGLSQVSFGAATPADLEAARPLLMLGIAAAGFGIMATQVGMFTLVASAYPTQCRSSAVGWASSVGRIGGIMSSFAGGWVLARHGEEGFFGIVAAVLVVTLIGVLAIRNHIPRGVRA